MSGNLNKGWALPTHRKVTLKTNECTEPPSWTFALEEFIEGKKPGKCSELWQGKNTHPVSTESLLFHKSPTPGLGTGFLQDHGSQTGHSRRDHVWAGHSRAGLWRHPPNSDATEARSSGQNFCPPAAPIPGKGDRPPTCHSLTRDHPPAHGPFSFRFL